MGVSTSHVYLRMASSLSQNTIPFLHPQAAPSKPSTNICINKCPTILSLETSKSQVFSKPHILAFPKFASFQFHPPSLPSSPPTHQPLLLPNNRPPTIARLHIPSSQPQNPKRKTTATSTNITPIPKKSTTLSSPPPIYQRARAIIALPITQRKYIL